MEDKNLNTVLDSGEFIDKEEYKENFSSNGRTSDYIPFLDEAKALKPGRIIYYDYPVPDSFVSGVRNQVYKLNDDDKEKSEWEYKVRATKEKNGRGNDVTDEQDRQLFTFSIRRMDG